MRNRKLSSFDNNHKRHVYIPRTAIIAILVLLQISAMTYGMNYLSDNFIVTIGVLQFINVIMVIRVLASRRNPVFKMGWLMLLLIFQPLTIPIYLIWGEGAEISRRNTARRHESALTYPEMFPPLPQIDNIRVERECLYLLNTTGFPAWQHTSSTFLTPGEVKFVQLMLELSAAKRFIYLEYFIISEGYMWDSIYEVLKKKAAEGLDVRLLFDDFGAGNFINKAMRRELRENGIKVCKFNRVSPLINVFMNYRDHRKIAVIDGYTGFLGGANIADEYINVKERFGYWKDTAIMLKGDAVYTLTVMFLQMWEVASSETPDYSKHAPIPCPEGSGYILPFGDGPINELNPAVGIYRHIIGHARKYLYIQTPYLILDYDFLTALRNASLSGVDVRIVTPEIPDKWYVHLLSRSFYKPLIEAGVRIYEYTPGFIHSKVYLSDDICGVVGSVNMDFRSLYLHYECAAYVAQCPMLADMKRDFEEDVFPVSKEITMEDCEKVGFLTRVTTALLNLFAPML